MGKEVEGGTETIVPGTETTVVTPVSLKDEDMVEVEVGGQKVQKSWKDARSSMMMHEDYTRKTQATAAQAKELKELFDGLTAKQKEILEKETALDAILGRSKPNEKPQAVGDDDVVTGKQARELLASALKEQSEKLTSDLTNKFSTETSQREQARQFARWEEKVDEVADRLVKEHPVLKRIPQLSLVLKREALSEKPENEKEMVAALVQAGTKMAKAFDDEVTERIKQKTVKKEELVRKGPQAPGGSSTSSIDTFVKDSAKYMRSNRGINFDKIEADVLAALDSLDE